MYYFDRIYNILFNLDENILLLVNGSHHPALDPMMWMVSDRWIWIPLYLILTVMVLRKAGFRRGVLALLLITAMIIATDQTCASVIRPAIGRLRPSNPSNPLSAMITLVNGYHGGRYGFPSCHAANTFALAVFLSQLFRNRYATFLLIAWSLLVSYSRLYLGVHYPGDIVGGYVVGAIYAITYYLPLRGRLTEVVRQQLLPELFGPMCRPDKTS